MTYIPTKDEINSQNAHIGKFIIRFEQICAFIRFTILRVCYPEYNKTQNENIEILLEGLTSDPLRKKLEALIHDNFPEEKELLQLNSKLSNKFKEMIPVRNSIAHGSMLIGWNSFDGKLSADTFLLKHSKTTKKGIDKNSMIINIKSIEKLIQQTLLIDSAYGTLCVLIDRTITKNNKEQYIEQLKNIINRIGTIKLDFEDKISK